MLRLMSDFVNVCQHFNSIKSAILQVVVLQQVSQQVFSESSVEPRCVEVGFKSVNVYDVIIATKPFYLNVQFSSASINLGISYNRAREIFLNKLA